MNDATQLPPELNPLALKILARIAYDPDARERIRAGAQESLRKRLPLLRRLSVDPSLSDGERMEIAAVLERLTAK